MISETISGVNYEFYDNINEMPEYRWQLFGLCLIKESAIGSDIYSVIQHHSKLDEFAANGMVEEVYNENANLRLCFYSILNGFNYTSQALAACIKSIGGVDLPLKIDVMNYTNDLQALPHGRLTEITDEIKKKFIPN